MRSTRQWVLEVPLRGPIFPALALRRADVDQVLGHEWVPLAEERAAHRQHAAIDRVRGRVVAGVDVRAREVPQLLGELP
jgi:hypothetical protein